MHTSSAFRRLGAALMLLASATSLAAQSGSRWLFRSSPSADLWYHGVALAGHLGFGAQPLYDPGYPAAVRRAREGRGVLPTPLEQEAQALGEAFAADSAFEVLHFVPLYFALAEPEEMLAALEAVSRGGREAAAAQPPRTRFGASATALVLASPAQRATLARFVAALRDEWPTYRSERGGEAASRGERLAAASTTWDAALGPALQRFLAAQQLDGGLVLPVPALGPEGRLFAGQPDDRGDNLVAVALPAGEPLDAAAYLAVRELSFPAARRALASAGVLPRDRLAAERLTGHAAAQLGRLHLARGAAAALPVYERVLLREAGCRDGFEACFPVPPAAATALGAAAR